VVDEAGEGHEGGNGYQRPSPAEPDEEHVQPVPRV
jgi:hypothetical protein